MTPFERKFVDEQDAHEQTKSELKVIKRAHRGTLGIMRIQIASLKHDKARLRREWSSVEGDHAAYMLAVAQWEGRTGLDMSEVLQGVYGKPLGNSS